MKPKRIFRDNHRKILSFFPTSKTGHIRFPDDAAMIFWQIRANSNRIAVNFALRKLDKNPVTGTI